MRKIAVLASLFWLSSGIVIAAVQGKELDKPRDIPAFSLSDSYGNSFTEKDLQDSWTLIMFGFNTCPDVCPLTLANLEEAISETSLRVSPSNVPEMVFVSVDPERDRMVVTNYAEFFHPDFRGVTGERDDIDRLVEATDSFYRIMKPDASGHYDVQHSAFVSVIAPDGQMRARLDPPFHAGKTAEFLARLQIAFRRNSIQ